MYGRAGAALRMLEYRNIPFTLTTDFPSLATVSSSFGAVGDTFAPPIVVDGDKTYSQSTAVCLWAGRKCGLDEGVDDIKAMQYLADMVDVFENGVFKVEGTAITILHLKPSFPLKFLTDPTRPELPDKQAQLAFRAQWPEFVD